MKMALGAGMVMLLVVAGNILADNRDGQGCTVQVSRVQVVRP